MRVCAIGRPGARGEAKERPPSDSMNRRPAPCVTQKSLRIYTTRFVPCGLYTNGAATAGPKVNCIAPAHKYSHDLFLVKILEPAEFRFLQNEQGSWMVHGKFHFASLKEVKVGDKLKISISPAAL